MGEEMREKATRLKKWVKCVKWPHFLSAIAVPLGVGLQTGPASKPNNDCNLKYVMLRSAFHLHVNPFLLLHKKIGYSKIYTDHLSNSRCRGVEETLYLPNWHHLLFS